MQKSKLLGFMTLTLLLLALIVPLCVLAVTVPTFSLSTQSNQLYYDLPAGTTFNGSITTTGSLRFWVSDPNFAEIVNLGIVDNSASFSFVAKQNGTYTFNFENDLPNTIQVSFSYTTNPTLPNSNQPGGFPSYLLIIVIVAIVGSLTIIFVGRRKRRTNIS